MSLAAISVTDLCNAELKSLSRIEFDGGRSICDPLPGPGNAIPKFLGKLFIRDDNAVTWSGHCYDYAGWLDSNGNIGNLSISVAGKSHEEQDCNDLFIFAVREGFLVKRFTSQFIGQSTDESFVWISNAEREDVEEMGLNIFLLEDHMLGEVIDILWFYTLLKNDKIDRWETLLYLQDAMNFEYRDRDNWEEPPSLSASDIQSGDYFAVTSFSGMPDILIMLGTGGRTTHVAFALWDDDVLYVLESVEPVIRKTPYEEWIKRYHAHKDGLDLVSVTRLKPSLAASFNESAVWEWFKDLEGLPYGKWNFIYGWIDAGEDNYPEQLNGNIMAIAFSMLDMIDPEMAQYYNDGLNLRWGTQNWTTEAILTAANAKNISFDELVSMIERDDWKYPGVPAPSTSLVCSCFAMEMYRVGGVTEAAGMHTFQATEFTPKDVYQIQLWDENPGFSSACGPNMHQSGLCQLVGRHWQDLPFYNAVKPYDNMNERCGAVPPEYIRTPADC